jgi:hypothetical protein
VKITKDVTETESTIGNMWNINSSSSTENIFGNQVSKPAEAPLFDFGISDGPSPFGELKFVSSKKSSNWPDDQSRSSSSSFFSSKTAQTSSSNTPGTGTVKRWTGERGFGFIRRADDGSDLFCHIRSLKGGLTELQEVNKSYS